jgi:KUP system potassium uptake protein
MASSTEAVSTPAIADHPVRARLLLGALGVVFGDIGTSPIYAFRESLKATGGASEAAVFGVLLLVFWAIVLIVAIKYVIFVMRADNDGEGGTMALLSLAVPVAGPWAGGFLIVGLAGASLFFGDAMITPAISVLSAVHGDLLAEMRDGLYGHRRRDQRRPDRPRRDCIGPNSLLSQSWASPPVKF